MRVCLHQCVRSYMSGGVCEKKEKSTWSACTVCSVWMLLNKVLNHDHKPQTNKTLQPWSHIPPTHTLNQTLLLHFDTHRLDARAAWDEQTKKKHVYANMHWTRFRRSLHVLESFSKVWVVRDWWQRPSPKKNYCRGWKCRCMSPTLTVTRRHWLFTSLTQALNSF